MALPATIGSLGLALRAAAGESSSSLAFDSKALDGLRAQAKAAPGAALKGAATQFEGLFLSMLLKSMREALPKDDTMDSDTTRTYTDMLDQQLALTLAKHGTGLSAMLVKQLSPGLATPAGPSAIGAAPAAQAAAPPAQPAAPAAQPAASVGGHAPAKSLHDKIQSFLDTMRPHAMAASAATGLPAKFLIGQAALETGWGKSEPKAPNGATSHNLFGIKAGSRWKGATVDATTTEYVAGKPVKAVQKFRAYASYGEAFSDYAKLMRNNPHYAKAVAAGNDAVAFAQGLQRAGYATDPHYADKLQQVIRKIA